MHCLITSHSTGAVWESRWPSWAVCPNEPSGFRGHKAILNHASACLSLICQPTSEDIKQHNQTKPTVQFFFSALILTPPSKLGKSVSEGADAKSSERNYWPQARQNCRTLIAASLFRNCMKGYRCSGAPAFVTSFSSSLRHCHTQLSEQVSDGAVTSCQPHTVTPERIRHSKLFY